MYVTTGLTSVPVSRNSTSVRSSRKRIASRHRRRVSAASGWRVPASRVPAAALAEYDASMKADCQRRRSRSAAVLSNLAAANRLLQVNPTGARSRRATSRDIVINARSRSISYRMSSHPRGTPRCRDHRIAAVSNHPLVIRAWLFLKALRHFVSLRPHSQKPPTFGRSGKSRRLIRRVSVRIGQRLNAIRRHRYDALQRSTKRRSGTTS